MSAFQGKVVLVTGAESGLGRLFASRFLQQGAILALTARPERLDGLRASFEEEIDKRVFVFGIDLQNIDAVCRLPSEVVAKTDNLDVVINNAGVRQQKLFHEVSANDWDELVNLNMRAPYFLTQAASEIMVGRARPGSIVNIASQLGLVAARGYSMYCISKAGLVAQTRALAVELARHKISVNAVAPGPTNTANAGLLRNDDDALDFLRRMPIGRRVEPLEVAQSVEYLAAQIGGAVTGHTLVVDGGWTIW